MLNPHFESQDALLKALQVSPELGLSDDEAARRLQQHGENKLAEKRKKTNLQRFLEQFKDAMIIILLFRSARSRPLCRISYRRP